METINIRLVKLSDYMDITMLSIQAGYEYPPHLIKERIKYILERTKDKIIVVENSEKQVIAFIHGVPQHSLHRENMVMIESLVVDTGYRRKGIARRIVRILENWARDNGYKGVELATTLDRRVAHRFYENIGYYNKNNQSNFIKHFSVLNVS